jgi:hypothetical protein
MFHKLWTHFCGLNTNATVEGSMSLSSFPCSHPLLCDVNELSSPSVMLCMLKLTARPSTPLAVSECRNLLALPGVLGLMTVPDDKSDANIDMREQNDNRDSGKGELILVAGDDILHNPCLTSYSRSS